MARDHPTYNKPSPVEIAAALCLGVGCLITLSICLGMTWSPDGDLLLALRSGKDLGLPLGPAWFSQAMVVLTNLGSSVVTGFLVVIATLLLLIAAAFRQAIFIAFAFAGAEFLGNGIKPLIGRLRPDIVPHLVEASGESFPSGHSTLSCAVYLGLALLWSSRIASRNGRFACMTTAIFVTGLVGFSRIFLGVHFPSDVIGGWALGAGWTLLAWRFLVQESSAESGTLNR